MNVDSGDMGEMADVLRRAQPGERVIPATIIPPPRGKYANKKGAGVVTAHVQTVATFNKQDGTPVVRYGPRKPLREVRRDLQAQREKAQEAQEARDVD